MKTTAKLALLIVILIVLSPLGLLLPALLKAGPAWGEWGVGELQALIGYVPRGLEKLSAIWDAPMVGYVCKGWSQKGILHLSAGYIISAVTGIGIVAAITIVLGKLLSGKK